MRRPAVFVRGGWALVVALLVASFAGWSPAVKVAMAVTLFQAVVLGWRARSATSLPVQVRLFYSLLLALGELPFGRPIHVAQLLGTSVTVLFDYCAAARLLSLLPWNRRGPLSLERLRATFLTPPVAGSILAVVEGKKK